MSDHEPSLLGIGDFSRFAQLSVRMLRYYDEHGLLTPAFVDPFTGFRYYEPQQLVTAARIRDLRDVGCGTRQIGELLALSGNRPALVAALTRQAGRLDLAATAVEEQRSLMARIIHQLKENTMSVTVSIRTLPAMRVLSRRRVLTNYRAEGDAWIDCNKAMAARHIDPADFGATWGATFYDDEYRDQNVDVALWGEFHGQYESDDDFTVEELPELQVAWARMVGPYEQTAQICQAIGEWISEHGYTPDGPMFNIYLVGPSQDPNPNNWVTDINFPVK